MKKLCFLAAFFLSGCFKQEPLTCPEPTIVEKIVEVEKKPEPRERSIPIIQTCPDHSEYQTRCFEMVLEQIEQLQTCQKEVLSERERVQYVKEERDRWQQLYNDREDPPSCEYESE